jgi:hypothetical protein
MAYRIILRRDTAQNWESNNPVLLSGEPGYETDSNKFKIGNGSSTWTNLAYYAGATGGTGATGPIGITGATGATGATGPMPIGYASTGSNEFYGDQSIEGNLTLIGGIMMNPQIFDGTSIIPDGYNGSLIGPITLTGEINVLGSGVLSIL